MNAIKNVFVLAALAAVGYGSVHLDHAWSAGTGAEDVAPQWDGEPIVELEPNLCNLNRPASTSASSRPG